MANLHDLSPRWQTQYPELATLLGSEKAYAAVNSYGMTYLRAVQLSFDEYGYAGLSMQLLYISNNLAKGNKDFEQLLIMWSRRIDKDAS